MSEEEQEKTEDLPSNEPKKKSNSSTIIIILLSVLLLLTLGAGGFLLFTSTGQKILGKNHDGKKHKEKEEKKETKPDHLAYYELPEMLVNLQSNSKRKPFLRLSLKLEVQDQEAIKTLDLIRPRIIDRFQIYLRQLRAEDLEGSAGSQKIKIELLKRVNQVADPLKINDVLFISFVIQ